MLPAGTRGGESATRRSTPQAHFRRDCCTPTLDFCRGTRESPGTFDTTRVHPIVLVCPRLGEGRWPTGAAGRAGS